MKTDWKQPNRRRLTQVLALGWIGTLLMLALPQISLAATAAEINRDVDIALKTLYQTTPAAKKMAGIAKGILVFPDIIKGGFIIGGQYGEGALRVGGKTTGFYRTIAASYGLQAGAQSFGYALFFLSDADLKYLKSSKGWEIGIGPTVVVMDEGMARTFSTTTAKSGIYAFFFDQRGLMAGLGIQGSKITQIQPDK
ncbi:twin-arginine translocation pathway signal [Desulfobulbus propionicus DSM 2032]|uniref:Twin-arginine translocation pathway signal n=1 Tax=Desulfobulbus propionicus (strain ATCC 33891 / DSM 2032 / VKM B-1956 / 1pr3) TaxID=577650 RepID=A0A7U3YL61_DESPD|nr:twin-arginine translocation pathway signal protein [Desulfobulbus propionicus]ADW17400.1 twin-arginine translocation pathway signal [Desulfobulbus propionicus DSM 2032]